jgi:ParB/RepB/Spo0J family partition protein
MNTPEFAHVLLADIEVSATNEMFREEADFEGHDFDELVSSIRKDGVIQPVLLRPGTKKKFQLVCGERRYRASLAVNTALKDRNTIPSYIRELNDDDSIQLQIIENLKRKDINPIKEAHAYQLMQKNMKISAAEIAKRIDKSPDYVEERLRLNKLKPEVQDYVRKGIVPLKAALKIARIPEHLHIEAIKECTETIDGANGKTIIFTGLANLQEWLNYNVFNDLASAEFDKEDTKLVPSAGSCTSCTQRTKNTGGLFDDISKKDVCLNGGCFRSKLTSFYLRVKEELKAKHPEATIVFKARGYSKEGIDPKKIAAVSYDEGTIITEKQAKDDKNARLAIYVGEAPNYGGISLSKKFDWITTSKVKSKSPIQKSTPQQLVAKQKDRDDKMKATRLQEFEESIMSREFLKQSKTLNPELLRIYIVDAIDNDNIQTEELLPALKEFGIDWEMNHREGRVEKRIFFRAKDVDITQSIDSGDYYINQKCAESFVSKVSGEKLNALFSWVMYNSVWSAKSTVLKVLKIDSKGVNHTAKVKLAAWWKEEQAKRKVPAPAAAGSKAKKGLSALSKK